MEPNGLTANDVVPIAVFAREMGANEATLLNAARRGELPGAIRLPGAKWVVAVPLLIDAARRPETA